MATVTLTEAFSNLDDWPGKFFDAAGNVSIKTHIATSFAYTFLPGSTFAGYTVTANGTGFAYSDSIPIGGTLKSLNITDASGHSVFSITGIAAASIASDVSLLTVCAFGWTDADGSVNGPDETKAWSYLMSGNDVIKGTAGDDREALTGLDAGNDTYNMGAGDDRVAGGLGNDTINGGDGWDELSYNRTKWNEGLPLVRGATVNMATGVVLDPYGYTDHINSVEAIHGSVVRDVFIGGATETDFSGGRGADKITAGNSDDYAIYSEDAWDGGRRGIVVNLQTSKVGDTINGTIRDGFGSLDQVTNIHNVTGTRYNDVFNGSSINDRFQGGEGKDSYNGGGGFDTADFRSTFTDIAQHGVLINMSRATGQVQDDGFGNVETLVSIESIIGSRQGDRIIGNTADNYLRGRDGVDTLTGGGGADEFAFYQPQEPGDNDLITDFRSGAGANQDRIAAHVTGWGGTTTLHLVIGTAATAAVETFVFNPLTHVLSWDSDGTGSAHALAIATLTGVTSLSAANFDLS